MWTKFEMRYVLSSIFTIRGSSTALVDLGSSLLARFLVESGIKRKVFIKATLMKGAFETIPLWHFLRP